MNVKFDTKEKFHVITPQEHSLSVNMTEEMRSLLLSCLEKPEKNVVLSLKEVAELDEQTATMLAELQQEFYDNKASFVICELKPNVEQWLDEKELLEVMNVTPTESEAWDIVQMEEIERELLGDE
ncbi:MAG: STAS domain-containing protein [Chitinophagaceae bacterium]|nr:STAS domain-containing protein [Chitinophagaceae bacterium]